MRPTSNTVLINGKQGAADQRSRSEEREGVIDCLANVSIERRDGRAEFDPRAVALSLVPLEKTSTSLQWASHWSRCIFDWHPQVAPTTKIHSLPSPSYKRNNVSGADWNSKASTDATGREGNGQAGQWWGGVCWGSLGPYKKQTLNHLTTTKLVVCESAGTPD